VPVAAAALTSEFGGRPPAPLPAPPLGETAPATGR
jgi:hypothetical protein